MNMSIYSQSVLAVQFGWEYSICSEYPNTYFLLTIHYDKQCKKAQIYGRKHRGSSGIVVVLEKKNKRNHIKKGECEQNQAYARVLAPMKKNELAMVKHAIPH